MTTTTTSGFEKPGSRPPQTPGERPDHKDNARSLYIIVAGIGAGAALAAGGIFALRGETNPNNNGTPPPAAGNVVPGDEHQDPVNPDRTPPSAAPPTDLPSSGEGTSTHTTESSPQPETEIPAHLVDLYERTDPKRIAELAKAGDSAGITEAFTITSSDVPPNPKTPNIGGDPKLFAEMWVAAYDRSLKVPGYGFSPANPDGKRGVYDPKEQKEVWDNLVGPAAAAPLFGENTSLLPASDGRQTFQSLPREVAIYRGWSSQMMGDPDGYSLNVNPLEKEFSVIDKRPVGMEVTIPKLSVTEKQNVNELFARSSSDPEYTTVCPVGFDAENVTITYRYDSTTGVYEVISVNAGRQKTHAGGTYNSDSGTLTCNSGDTYKP